MAKVEIEKGIKIPPERRRERWLNTLSAMQPGDSVLFGDEKTARSFMASARNKNIKMVWRRIGNGKVRLWRK